MAEGMMHAEIQALRAEQNSVIDRMNNNENFCAGTVSAVFAFIASAPGTPYRFVLAFAASLVLFVGCRRYYELLAHSKKLDAYLKKIEDAIAPETGGWTSHYYTSIAGSRTGGYSFTRYVFWAGLSCIVLLCYYVALSELISKIRMCLSVS